MTFENEIDREFEAGIEDLADELGGELDGDLDGEESVSVRAEESVEQLAEEELSVETASDTSAAVERSLSSSEGESDEPETPLSDDGEDADDVLWRSDVAPRKANETVCSYCFCLVPILNVNEDGICSSCN